MPVSAELLLSCIWLVVADARTSAAAQCGVSAHALPSGQQLCRALQDTLESEYPIPRSIAQLSHLQLQLLVAANRLVMRSRPLNFQVCDACGCFRIRSSCPTCAAIIVIRTCALVCTLVESLQTLDADTLRGAGRVD